MQLTERRPLQLLPVVMDLISSSDREQVDTIMNRLIDNYRGAFDFIVTGDHGFHKTPAADICCHMLNVLLLSGNGCLAFKNPYAGILSVKAAGVIGYAVRNHYADADTLQCADRVVDLID